MSYTIELSRKAEQDLKWWASTGKRKTLQKIYDLFEELREHPMTGTGQVEPLKGNLSGYWSRRIDKGSRLVYSIENEVVKVFIVSLKGHYEDLILPPHSAQ
jgi:toxin YoeB